MFFAKTASSSLLLLPLCVTLSLAFLGCASKKKKSEKGSAYKDRVFSNWDNSNRSSFEKQAGIGKKKDVKTNAFKTRDFKSGKTFSEGDHHFKTGDFSQAGKKSSAADKTFQGGNKESSLGNDTFRTTQSRFDDQRNSNSNKISPLGNDTFRTGNNREGTKAIENSKTPLIESKSADDYSESFIRRILNKD